MMKKRVRWCSFGLVFILTGILAFIGMTTVEAKKPKPEPAAQWQVAIPINASWNLIADCENCENDPVGRAIFEDQSLDEGPVRVGGGNRRNKLQFSLMFTTFHESYGVTIKGLSVGDPSEVYPGPPNEPYQAPCDFPSNECIVDFLDPPECMACFLNGDHPHPDEYDFSLQIKTDEDTQKSSSVTGNVFIDMWNDGDYHWVYCYGFDAVDVTEGPEPDQWVVTSNNNATLTCEEFYLGERKGDRWEGIWGPRTPTYTVMTATTSPFEFEAIWTKTSN